MTQNLKLAFEQYGADALTRPSLYEKAHILYAYLTENPKEALLIIRSDKFWVLAERLNPENLEKDINELECEYWDAVNRIFAVFEKPINKLFLEYCKNNKCKQIEFGEVAA